MEKFVDYGRNSLGMLVHEATSSVTLTASDRLRHQLHPLGSDQPDAPIPLRAVVASAPGRALKAFCAAIRRGEIEAPPEGDRIGLWLKVDRVGRNEERLKSRFLGTAMVREGRWAIEPHSA